MLAGQSGLKFAEGIPDGLGHAFSPANHDILQTLVAMEVDGTRIRTDALARCTALPPHADVTAQIAKEAFFGEPGGKDTIQIGLKPTGTTSIVERNTNRHGGPPKVGVSSGSGRSLDVGPRGRKDWIELSPIRSSFQVTWGTGNATPTKPLSQ